MRGVLSADANLPASSVGRLAFANGAVRGVAACLVWMLILKWQKDKPDLNWQADGIEALIRSLFELSTSWAIFGTGTEEEAIDAQMARQN